MSTTPRKRNWFMRLRPVLRWVLKLRSSPRAIAGGLGVGMFVAFTPTVGIQIILAIIAATICNVNRPAAVVPVWITNPVTVAPVYTFNYWLGTFIYPGPPLSEVSKVFADVGHALARLDFWDMKEPVLAMLQLCRWSFCLVCGVADERRQRFLVWQCPRIYIRMVQNTATFWKELAAWLPRVIVEQYPWM